MAKPKPVAGLVCRHGVKTAIASCCYPGASPLTSLLLAVRMAATLFRLPVGECFAGVTRKAARAPGGAGVEG